MGTTRDLQNELKTILGSDNVYFQAPTNLKMKYPCFLVERDSANHQFADNKTYQFTLKYLVTYISYDPEPDIIKEMVHHFPMCTYDRPYVSDNLHHDTFSLYW